MEYLTPPQLAKELSVDPERVRLWIRTGQLAAVNLATDPNGKRPRWRITRAAVDKFLAARKSPERVAVAENKKRVRRRRKMPVGMVEYW